MRREYIKSLPKDRRDRYDKQGAKYREANAEKLKMKDRISNLRKNYGLELEQYNLMFENQNGLCAICNHPEKLNRMLSVDHNHNTGEIRALLCQRCNFLIGMANENLDTLISAVSYLRSHNYTEEK